VFCKVTLHVHWLQPSGAVTFFPSHCPLQGLSFVGTAGRHKTRGQVARPLLSQVHLNFKLIKLKTIVLKNLF